MPLFLVIMYLKPVSLTTGNKSEASSLLQITIYFFKNQNKLSNAFCFNDCNPEELISGATQTFQCELCHKFYYGFYIRYFSNFTNRKESETNTGING